MNNTVTQWSYDTLWSKARLYIERALAEDTASALFPFWASLSLEFLARATLASVHPALLAENGERDGRNVLYAFGFTPKVKNFVPRSIDVTAVFTRCQQIVPSFTSDLEAFCAGLAGRRNEELHSGGLPFEDLHTRLWLPRFYLACEALLGFQSKTLEDFVGEKEATAARQMLSALTDEAAKSVRKIINAHAEIWKNRTEEDREQQRAEAEKQVHPWLGHLVPCPACSTKALLTGEQVRQQPARLEDDELVVRATMLPTQLKCLACGLVISGHNQLHAAELGGTFTLTDRYDPFEYYAPEPEPEWDSYMNE
jgi:hypothetical protein